jgi:hypothetical protein
MNGTQVTLSELIELITGVLLVSGSSRVQLGGRNLLKLAAIVGLTREGAGDDFWPLDIQPRPTGRMEHETAFGTNSFASPLDP